MCIRVHPISTICPAYDADRRIISIPAGLDEALAVTAVRAVLAELGVEQPVVGAVCWCGEPIPRVQQQVEVITVGS